MTNRHLLSRIARLERELRDRAPDYDAFMQAMRRASERTRVKFIEGTSSAPPTERDLADERTIETYLRATGLDRPSDADRDRSRLLEFADNYGKEG